MTAVKRSGQTLFRILAQRVVLFALGLSWGAAGIWWAMFVSNVVIAAAGFFWLSRGRRLHKIDPASL